MRRRSGICRSSSACAAATLAAPWRKRRSGSRENVKLPTGYRLVWAGEFEDMEVAQHRLEIVVPVALVLILALLYSAVQFGARQPAGAGGHPLRHRRRHHRAVCHRSRVQHLVGDRLHLVVRRVGDERDPDHHLLQPGADRRDGRIGRVVPCRRTADAADADDVARRLHRPAAGRDVERDRQPGAEAAGDGGGWRHADRADLAAAGGAGAAAGVPGQGRRRADRCNTRRPDGPDGS